MVNSGDTAFILIASALVLLMTPGLALFYGGLGRQKNVGSTMMYSFATIGIVGVVWVLWGYTLAFGPDIGGFIGGLDYFGLAGVSASEGADPDAKIPAQVFMIFQGMFAIITPALITGAFAERMKFSAFVVFTVLWVTIVYTPVAHWVWASGGWLFEMGALDFAGGTVVHINAGIAGLVAALVLGKRKGYPTTPMPPHNLGYTLVGAAMLWVGWFGFNAGSELAADGTAGMAMLVTQVSTATAALAWMSVEWMKHGKPSVLGIVTGAVAGLVAITPASGSVGPMGAIALGAASGVLCFWGSTMLKQKLGYDDSLDAFGVHGIGGIVGAMLTGVFVSKGLGGLGLAEGTTMASQVWSQFVGVAFTVIYCAVLSFVILKIVDALVGLRVTEEDEDRGLDISLHNEQGYYSDV